MSDDDTGEQVKRGDFGKKACDECEGSGVDWSFPRIPVLAPDGSPQAIVAECGRCRGRGYLALIFQRDGGNPTVVSFVDLAAGAKRRFDEGKLSRKSLDVVMAFCAPTRRTGT